MLTMQRAARQQSFLQLWRCFFWCLIWGEMSHVWFDKGWATWEELCFCHRISKSMRSAWRWQMPVYLYWSPAANDDNPFRNRWRNLGTWELLDTFFLRGKFAQSSLKHNQHSGQSFQNWRSTRCWHLLRNGPLMFFSLTWSLALLFDIANLQRWSAQKCFTCSYGVRSASSGFWSTSIIDDWSSIVVRN